jgi:hypothetical protein
LSPAKARSVVETGDELVVLLPTTLSYPAETQAAGTMVLAPVPHTGTYVGLSESKPI